MRARLKKIYESLTSKITLEKRETKITATFAGLAAGLSLLSAALSFLWFHRETALMTAIQSSHMGQIR
jgi:Ca-activated chloride channel homolog